MNIAGHEQLLDGLSPDLQAKIRKIHTTFTSAGRDCYLVGGLVRDLLLGRSGQDVDIATDARPEQVQKLFRRTIPTGIKHGTITVMIDDTSFEVTTYRADGDYGDGRRPDTVNFSDTLHDDLARRDFTINALAYEPGRCELVDEFDGLADLEARRIRTIGDPRQRFYEDGLRPVRACRFAATLEFDPVAETLEAIHDPDIQKRTALVAIERFSDELWKGFKSARPERMIRLLEATGLLDIFDFPVGMRADDRLEELSELGACAPTFKLAWWWRAAGLAPETFEERGKQLKFSSKQIRDIRHYHDFIDFQIAAERPAPDEKAETEARFRARGLLSRIKKEYRGQAARFLEGAPALPGQWFAHESLIELLSRDPLVLGDLAINGQDLQKAGFAGQAIGRILNALLEAVWRDPGLNERETLLGRLDGFQGG